MDWQHRVHSFDVSSRTPAMTKLSIATRLYCTYNSSLRNGRRATRRSARVVSSNTASSHRHSSNRLPSQNLNQTGALSSFLRTCRPLRTSHAYTSDAGEPSISTQGTPRMLDIFSAPTPANETFLAEMSMLANLNYLDSILASDCFVALELTGIPKLAASYGRSSKQYKLTTDTLRASIDAVLADKSPGREPGGECNRKEV